MESTDSSSGSQLHQQQPQLPPGFRFHPTDEELVVHYLKRKVASAPLPVAIIAEVDLYKFDPWELPGKATFGEQEWYFFSPRERKYPNGARPNRAATSGYWKATGTDKPILSSGSGGGTQKKVGVKKALVFYGGKPPKGIKTNWIMHEYRLTEQQPNSNSNRLHTTASTHDSKKASSRRLDDWVLCRIYKKNNNNCSTQRPVHMERESDDSMDNMLSVSSSAAAATMPMPANPPAAATAIGRMQNQRALNATNYSSALLDNDGTFFEGFLNEDTNHHQNQDQATTVQLVAPTFQAKHPHYWCDAAEASNMNVQSSLASSKTIFQSFSNGKINISNVNADADDADHEGDALIHQIPQSTNTTANYSHHHHHHSVLGSLQLQGDGSSTGGFRQVPYQLLSRMNWRAT